MRILACCVATIIAHPALASAGAPVRAVFRDDLVQIIDMGIQKDLPELKKLYTEMHAHPELSLQEVESAKRIAEHLTQYGYEVTTGIGGHGVVGIMSHEKGPTILIRGDMDALPITEETSLPYKSKVTAETPDGHIVGVMHACGHDVHQTCLLGTAKLLAETKKYWNGTVMIVAQPAEEIGTGAKAMIDDELFERFGEPNYCLALHVTGDLPAGKIGYSSGWALANVDSVDITIWGRGGHGSRPNQTVDPIVTAAQVVTALQTVVSRRVDPIDPAVITVGSIHAGSKHNIIPERADLKLTVRSYSDATRKTLLDGIREITFNTCKAMGCPKDPDIVLLEDEFTPSTYNDPDLVSASVAILGQAIGADNVKEVPARMGGEDFGRYPKTSQAPGFIYWLGSVEQQQYEASQKPGALPLPPLHSSKYAPDPEPTIRTGVKAMTSLALALLEGQIEEED